MKIREDQVEYQHKHKRNEMDFIFSKCPEHLFSKGLELGAGDGFQATLLAKYVSKLISTELRPEILKNKNAESIEYRICNAEEVASMFDSREFDLVFSSNLLEHLSNLHQALSGIREVLKDDGITIHIMPNPFWKFCHLLFYIPNRFIIAFERRWGKREFAGTPKENAVKNNRKPLIYRLLALKPHGVSGSNFSEFYAFTKSRWRNEFKKANLELIKIIKGPVASGYGFGLDRLRNIMQRFGFASEYIYIAIKKNQDSCYRHYFENI